ncbi:piggyBac transposable element-derived protein 4-like [Nematolebias whitei]|uniref:piggyBac transposable element-derived protein 4-like n=1 Tax=Nematolebias whitei TaxID=451745 RepID=UPI0018997349|nr:piggyBac transposable element-derived protein 4-like [Nematolebias whitei]
MNETVVAATNAAAEHRPRWRRMGRAEFRAYVGLLVLAGVFRSRGEACESLWCAETGRRVFRETMPLGQFRVYSAALRFDDRETRDARRAAGDRLTPIGELWRAWTERLPLAYRPGDSVTVDERLVPFRGRCGFRQYMPCKPARYGLKLWVACDSRSSYAWRMQAYVGKRDKTAPPERDLTLRVVLDLTEGVPAGTLVTMDNFFTSPRLATRLAAERGLHLLGTLRANRARGLPRALLESAREPRSCRFAFTRDACAVSYVPKWGMNVLLLTSEPSLLRLPDDEEDTQRPDGKPPALLRYNATKGGVDNLDKVTAAYSVRRKTARWPVRELHPDWLRGKRDRRRRFLEQLGLELTRDLAATVAADEPPPPPPPLCLALTTRKRCSVCPRAKDVKTRAACGRCAAPLCLGCAALLCPSCLHGARR